MTTTRLPFEDSSFRRQWAELMREIVVTKLRDDLDGDVVWKADEDAESLAARFRR